jgi:hypothetical protein
LAAIVPPRQPNARPTTQTCSTSLANELADRCETRFVDVSRSDAMSLDDMPHGAPRQVHSSRLAWVLGASAARRAIQRAALAPAMSAASLVPISVREPPIAQGERRRIGYEARTTLHLGTPRRVREAAGAAGEGHDGRERNAGAVRRARAGARRT